MLKTVHEIFSLVYYLNSIKSKNQMQYTKNKKNKKGF